MIILLKGCIASSCTGAISYS